MMDAKMVSVNAARISKALEKVLKWLLKSAVFLF